MNPYRPYSGGQSVSPIGVLSARISGYYPLSNNRMIVESVDNFRYKVRPINYDETIDVDHWELFPNNLERTRFFVPNNTVREGVVVSPIGTKMKFIISESRFNSITYNKNIVVGQEMVEIYRTQNDPNDILYFLKDGEV